MSSIEIVSPAPDEIMGDAERIRKFYSTFIITIAQVINQHKGKILKSFGDGLLSYFPQVNDPTNVAAIKDVLECCLQQMERRQSLSIEIDCKELPEISYRICSDYDTMFEYDPSSSDDAVLNIASPRLPLILSETAPNTVVLGDDLYQTISTFPQLYQDYAFERTDVYLNDVRKKIPYSLWSVSRRL